MGARVRVLVTADNLCVYIRNVVYSISVCAYIVMST